MNNGVVVHKWGVKILNILANPKEIMGLFLGKK
jgi:hypothetical protein